MIAPAATDLEDLSASELLELASIYTSLADRRRRPIPVDEARAVVATIELSPVAQMSEMRYALATRYATRYLIEHNGWHWTQVAGVLLSVCEEHIPDRGIGETAVAAGVEDWRRSR